MECDEGLCSYRLPVNLLSATGFLTKIEMSPCTFDMSEMMVPVMPWWK